VIPKQAPKHAGSFQRRKARERFRRRAGIEAIISHLKFDYPLVRNYITGIVGDRINLMLAAAAFNFKKLMTRLHILLHFLVDCLVTHMNQQIQNIGFFRVKYFKVWRDCKGVFAITESEI